MRTNLRFFSALIMLFFAQIAFAQVSGTVYGADGSPEPDAMVKVVETGTQTITDLDGNFTIDAKIGQTLEVSGDQLETKKFPISSTKLSLTMKTAQQMADVVVLGYNVTKTKPKSIAAATTVSEDVLENRPNVTLLQSLQGVAPGLNVTTSSGQPGSARLDLVIRGTGSLNGYNDPLYVVDDIPVNSVVFRNINPEDIKYVSILRDAAATSIYGNRGANGVVIIKTKSGSFSAPLKFSYSATTGISFFPKSNYNMSNAQDALRLERTWGYGAGNGDNDLFLPSGGLGTPMTDNDINSYDTTNWESVLYRKGFSQAHNISMAGGGENLSNFTSLSYVEQKGIVTTTDFKRFTLRTNFNGKTSNAKFNYAINSTLAYSRRHQLNEEVNSANIGTNVIQNALLGVLTAMPYYSANIYPGTGQGLYNLIGTNFNLGHSALVLQDVLQEGNLPTRVDELKILVNSKLSYKLSNTLTFNSSMGVDYTKPERIFARAPWSYLAIAVREGGAVPYGGLEQRRLDRDFGFSALTSLNYKKEIGKHSIDAGVYLEYLKAERQLSLMQQNGLFLNTYSFGAGTGWTNVGGTYASLRPTVSALKAKAGNLSYFANAEYDYDSKYGITALVRRDASYRFTDDYQWGTFWATGVRWNIDKEAFMQNSGFSMLKLRASYGKQGNQNFVDVAADENPIYAGNNNIRDLVGAGTTSYQSTGSLVLTQLANTSLQWEDQYMYDAGLDFEVFNKRLSGNIDVYKRITKNLFTTIPISAGVGFGSNITGNNGEMENTGIEVALSYKVIKSDNLNLSVFANGSYNKNEVTKIEEVKYSRQILREGLMAYEYFLVPYIGVNPANGNALFLDINNNVTENITADDRRPTGKSTMPEYVGGFGFNADYKGFYLDANFSFKANYWRVDNAWDWIHDPESIGNYNVSSELLNAWTPTNTNTDVPALEATNLGLASDYSDRNLFNSSYVRLKALTFGYSISKSLLEGTGISSLKLFVQGENLLTWTDWKGYDPENSTVTFTTGIFPNPKVFSFGINVDF